MKPSYVSRLSFIALLCVAACSHVAKRPAGSTPSSEGVATEAAAPSASAKTDPAAPVPELVEVRVLVVTYRGAQGARPDEPRDKEQALERARMIARMARSGDKLAELVRKYSDRPGASEDMGLFRIRPAQPGAFGKNVADAAAALAQGQISEPVDGPEGWFVIERRPDPPVGPARISARHILISYKGAQHAMEGVTRTEAEARALAEQIDQQAKSGSDWAQLAAQYTDEPGSKETGGDLGRFGRGQMVPAFEKAAFALQVGQVSDVVQTPFGFHVIQRYE